MRFAAVATTCVALAALGATGADLPGRARSRVCASCHGPLGISVQPDAPNLAGQPRIYLEAQLKAFRDGTRKHQVMSLMARTLTDEDIAALAEWYASITVEVREPS